MMTGRESYSAVAMVTGAKRREGGGKQNMLVCQEHSLFHKQRLFKLEFKWI
jgi:hypothetical protein